DDVSTGASTIDGVVLSPDWIQYLYPLDSKTLEENLFWDAAIPSPEYPDLVPINLWNQGSAICYRLENNGSVTAAAGHISGLYVDNALTSSHLVESSLAPGELLDACFDGTWSCSLPDDLVKVVADSENAITETLETNNIFQTTFACDTTPPQITSGPQLTALTQNSATIVWETDESSNSRVMFGVTQGEYPNLVVQPSLVISHTVSLDGLQPSTTYQFMVQSSDFEDNTTTSKPFTFQTLADSDLVAPTIFLIDPGVLTGNTILSASAADNTGISRVIFRLDGGQDYSDYQPPFEFPVDSTLLDNGLHDVSARVFDLVGNQSQDSLQVDVANLKDASSPVIQITNPANDATVSGIVTVTAQISDDTGVISARFYVDGDYQQFESYSVTNPPTSTTASFGWDTRGLINDQKYRLGVEVYDTEGKNTTAVVDVFVKNVAPPPPPSPPILKISSHVVLRNQNRFVVLLSIKNVGDAEARNINIQNAMYGFHPIANNNAQADIRPEYNPIAAWSYADIYSKVTIPAGETRIYTFNAIPYLLNPNPKTPAIGFFIYMNWVSPTNNNYFATEWLPVGKTVGGETIPAAHAAAIKSADYLIVTNPYRLFAIFNPSYYQGPSGERWWANRVLSDMAELAFYQKGVLGFNHTYTSESLRDLVKQGGIWSSKLAPGWTSKGYMLIVGEVNVVSAWWRNYGTVQTTKGDTPLIVSYTDYPYGSTFGDEARPEISIARIIGNNTQRLSTALETHIKKAKGTVGYSFSGQNSYLVSGFPKTIGGNSDDINFLAERNKVATMISGSKVTLNTPDLTIKDSNGDIDIDATTLAITSTVFNSLGGVDIFFMAGHGNSTSWDVITGPDVYQQNDPFGASVPFVFASSCSTAEYPNGVSFGEDFLNKEAGAYLGAIKHGLCSGHTCPNADLFFSKWNTNISFAQALKDTKNALGNGLFDRFWNGIYLLFGDAKFGIVSTAPDLSPATIHPTNVTQGVPVEIFIPTYEITQTVDGFDFVTIPGGGLTLEPGQPQVPSFQVALDFPAGTQVQDVLLLERAFSETIPGLNLPPATIAIPGGDFLTAPAADLVDEWIPSKDYEWFITENPLTTTLVIRAYPLRYNPLSSLAEFYDYYKFEPVVISSTVEIHHIHTDAPVYQQGDVVTIDLGVETSAGIAQNAVLHAAILDGASGEQVTGLLLETLADLHDLASTTLWWDTSSHPQGDYMASVSVRTHDGVLLDQRTTPFQVGTRLAALSDFSTSQAAFLVGEPVTITVSFENSGTIPISGTVTINAHHPDEGILTPLELPVPLLEPGQQAHLEGVWDTSGIPAGTYFLVAQGFYPAAVTEPEILELVANSETRIFLPIVFR
ncbi:MAG: Ig-like domain-containing protein, partial [Anaerolineales bacterium]|nr:Ig-like domain-containing protein [Anaerolineales bacterium]